MGPSAEGDAPEWNGPVVSDMIVRQTLCLPQMDRRVVIQRGDEDFPIELGRHFRAPESDAAEKLFNLKMKLREANTYDFWAMVVEGIVDITNAQCGFVAKRILMDDADVPVEMPHIGEEGSCLMGLAFHFDDGHGMKETARNWKYHAYSCPCAYMKHEKVFIIPDRISELLPHADNPNSPPFPPESYIGVPLFSEGKCFAHFGAFYTAEGIAGRKLSWAFIEMVLHSLEDMIQQRMIDGQGFTGKKVEETHLRPGKVIPREAVSASQSLKPYARSLSHELRTPMQGVVGMLDVMYANVQEASEGMEHGSVRNVLQTLRENIEVVQDSSRRAVEAADNVVHAYDLNMEVPGTPPDSGDVDDTVDVDESSPKAAKRALRPDIFIEGHEIGTSSRGKKRRRQSGESDESPAKQRPLAPLESHLARERTMSPRRRGVSEAVKESQEILDAPSENHSAPNAGSTDRALPATSNPVAANLPQAIEASTAPGLRPTKLRELLPYIITESMRVGGRPDSAIAVDTEFGERIEVRSRGSNSQVQSKTIEWLVDPAVPDTFLTDERDLAKLISCVFLNAFKFTEVGKIVMHASLSPTRRFVVIDVKDTGSGIPSDFLPYLFKPFSREDDSLTRQTEGLGLGLLVAKGLARKIKGDLVCLRSSTSGPDQGSEFSIRVPVTPGEASMPGSPRYRTPTPVSHSNRASSGVEVPLERAESNDRLMPREPHLPNSAEKGRSSPIADLLPRISSPLHVSSHSRRNSLGPQRDSRKKPTFDTRLAEKHPVTFLVAEDNKINRKLLYSMLRKLGYKHVYEAYDGAEAVRQMKIDRSDQDGGNIDVVLMDLWMPNMDGYEATRRILDMQAKGTLPGSSPDRNVTVLAVSADVTGEALEKAAKAGMKGFMTKPYKLLDLERLIIECCQSRAASMHTTMHS